MSNRRRTISMSKMTKAKSKLKTVLGGGAQGDKDAVQSNPAATKDRGGPRQRGRPPKTTLGSKTADKGNDSSTNSASDIIKVLLRILKDQNKSMVTTNNGFARGLKPDSVVAGFQHEGELMLAVKFKNRKLPEVISSAELRMRAPKLLIQFYLSNMYYDHNE